MGVIIQARAFFKAEQGSFLKPVIYCGKFDDTKSEAASINIHLAKELIEFPPNQRSMRLEQCFRQVIDTLCDGVVIKDFDVMFNPEYKVDLLRIMIATCKNKPFNVLWPGKCENGKLFYSEEGYADYKIFNIEDYDITCIV